MNRKNIGLLLLFAFTLFFQANAQSTSSLKINEVMVINETNFMDNYGEKNAWIEIYNNSFASVNIEGCYLTNDKSNPKKYQIPKGDVLTVIKPRQHLLFWADNKPSRGTFHLNFTLDSTQENYLALFDSNGKTLLDEVVIPAHMLADQSYARIEDGSDQWVIKGETDAGQVTPSSNNTTNVVNEKILNFEKHDSSGFGMSITAMTVVFTGLILLFLSFKFVGKIAVNMSDRNAKKANKTQIEKSTMTKNVITGDNNNEEIVAIAMALHEHLADVHDVEEMVLTFKEIGESTSPWAAKAFGLRQFNN